jgi:type IV pilus assembly protein PilV
MNIPIATYLRYQSGIVLLEGLIAILIFSIGILAIVGLQAASINNSRDAKFRVDASFLANQIIGQMWADRSNLSAYSHFATAAGCAAAGSAASTSFTPMNNWLADVTGNLPSATSSYQSINIGTNNLVTVTVCWKAPQDASYHSHTVTAQING